jgi:hypothetical protein
MNQTSPRICCLPDGSWINLNFVRRFDADDRDPSRLVVSIEWWTGDRAAFMGISAKSLLESWKKYVEQYRLNELD